MKILDYTALQTDEFYLPSSATEESLRLLPKWSSVYVFCLRVLRNQQMTFDQCHDALMWIWNNVPVCLVTSDMAGKMVGVQFYDCAEPIHIPHTSENEGMKQLNLIDQYGAYSRLLSANPLKRQVVFIYVDKIMETAGKEHYDTMFTFTVLHEMMHAMLDIDVADEPTPIMSRNSMLLDMSRHYFLNREEVIANALAVMFLMKIFPDDCKYAVDYVQSQPKPYCQIFDVMKSEQFLLMQASQWLLYKKKFDGVLGTYVYGPEKIIEMPHTIISYEYAGLTSFIFPKGTKSICFGFLSDFIGLQSVIIPEGVKTIEYMAFHNCSNLREIVLPSSLTELSRNAFGGCGSIEHITVNEENEKYYSGGECLIEKGSDIVVLGCSKSVIPDICSGIGEYAFADCKGLTEIRIPNNLYVIKPYAFVGCDGLKKVVIPIGTEHVGRCAFYGCKNLEEIFIHGAPHLYYQCFAQCRKLQKVLGFGDKCIIADKTAFLVSDKTADFDIWGGISMVDEL